MRDIALAVLLAGIVPASVARPWFGALAWVWISVMSPHRMTYGFMYDFPVAQVIGLATILGLAITAQPRKLTLAPPVVWMMLFTVWMCITYPFSLVDTPENWYQLDKVLKVMIMNLVVLMALHTRRHVDLLIAVLTLSLMFFGVKGGIFAIVTGGQFQVRGGGGFIEPNNELALALVTAIPLAYYLLQQTERRTLRLLIAAGMFLMAIAAMTSHSRGGLVAMLGMCLAFLVRSTNRRRLVLPMLAAGAAIAAFMPESWWDRMATIDNYGNDRSAMGRINAWLFAWNVATSHFFGGGFYLETPELFDRYAPQYDFIAVAHSNYFQVLGQHGFVGLAFYLGIWIATFRACYWIYRHSSSTADKQLVRMVEVSLAGFFVGGAFLSLAYWDGPYYIMVAMVILRYKVIGNQPVDRRATMLSDAGLTSPRAPRGNER